MTQTDRMAEIEALLAAATPGPWTVRMVLKRWYVMADLEPQCSLYQVAEVAGASHPDYRGPGQHADNNAALIAAAPGHLRWLLDELRPLKVLRDYIEVSGEFLPNGQFSIAIDSTKLGELLRITKP